MKPSGVLGFCCCGKMLTKSNFREIGLISAYSGEVRAGTGAVADGECSVFAPHDLLSCFLIQPRTTVVVNYYY